MQWGWFFSVHVKDAKYFFYDIFMEKKSIFLETEFPGRMDLYTGKKEKLKNRLILVIFFPPLPQES